MYFLSVSRKHYLQRKHTFFEAPLQSFSLFSFLRAKLLRWT